MQVEQRAAGFNFVGDDERDDNRSVVQMSP